MSRYFSFRQMLENQNKKSSADEAKYQERKYTSLEEKRRTAIRREQTGETGLFEGPFTWADYRGDELSVKGINLTGQEEVKITSQTREDGTIFVVRAQIICGTNANGRAFSTPLRFVGDIGNTDFSNIRTLSDLEKDFEYGCYTPAPKEDETGRMRYFSPKPAFRKKAEQPTEKSAITANTAK